MRRMESPQPRRPCSTPPLPADTQRWTNMRGERAGALLLWGLLSLVLVVGCSNRSDEKKPPFGRGSRPADVTLTATQLGEELKKDPQGTLNRYLNKRVDVSGE